MRAKTKLAFGIIGAIAVTFFWPIITPVSGHTKIVIRKEDASPVAGANIRQSWGVYGWGGFGGKASAVTDSAGMAAFPPRKNVGFLGVRLFRRAQAAITQITGKVLFEGRFGSAFTHRWGPLVGFDIDLPRGNWLPMVWPAADTARDDLVLPILGDGPHRYIYLRNLDPMHPNAYVSGDALGFIDDTEVVLRIRRATPEEERFIRENRMRQDTVAWSQKHK